MDRTTPIIVLAVLASGCSGGGTADTGVGEVVESVGDYDPCTTNVMCPIDTLCHELEIDYGDVIVVDAMCTVACGSDLDCFEDGICLGASSGPPLCYEPCFDDFDCPVGFGCVQDTSLSTFDPVCMPI